MSRDGCTSSDSPVSKGWGPLPAPREPGRPATHRSDKEPGGAAMCISPPSPSRPRPQGVRARGMDAASGGLGPEEARDAWARHRGMAMTRSERLPRGEIQSQRTEGHTSSKGPESVRSPIPLQTPVAGRGLCSGCALGSSICPSRGAHTRGVNGWFRVGTPKSLCGPETPFRSHFPCEMASPRTEALCDEAVRGARARTAHSANATSD